MLATRQGYIIHFKLDEVNILAGVGKGVIGIKLGDDDTCIGGTLIGGSRFDKIVVEQSNGKEAPYGREARRLVGRGGKGDEVVKRLTHVRVVPPTIELVNWDEAEGKNGKPKGNGTLFG